MGVLTEDIFGLKVYDWYPVLWTDPNGLEFYLLFLKRNGFWYCWLKVKADREAAAKFNCSVKVENAETGLKMEFSGKVHPVDDGVGKIMSSGHFLVMQNDHVKTLKVKVEESLSYRDKLKILFSVVP